MTISDSLLTNCDLEPIHILGSIQPQGYLAVLQPDTLRVVHVSENIPELTGQSVVELLGQQADALFQSDPEAARHLQTILKKGGQQADWEGFNPYVMTIHQVRWNLIIHHFNELLLLEWEPIDTSTDGYANQQLVNQALVETQNKRPTTELLQQTAIRIKQIIGFDRVMVYRFGADWHGEVVAEAREEGVESYLGQHFPASDIPRQARELYKVNLVRQIADVNRPASRIATVSDWPANQPLDLTPAGLRAVSPIHIQYLKNMGVGASMSLSLLSKGELWGLIACHHYQPRFVDFSARQAARFVSQLLSATLEFRDNQQYVKQLDKKRNLSLALQHELYRGYDLVKGLVKQSEVLLQLVDATGVAIRFDGRIDTIGHTPDADALEELFTWLSKTQTDTVLQTSELAVEYPPANRFSEIASGLLSIELSRELGEYVLWFKPERIQQLTWAGNPNKPIQTSINGLDTLSPRTSFESWIQTVRGTSSPWSEADVALVLELREDILQLIRRQANEIRVLNQRLTEAYETLDAFSYTVSHDLRTPLSSIRCYAEILNQEYDDALGPDEQALVQKITDLSDRMQQLIRNILHYSRTGSIEIQPVRIDMRNLLSELRTQVALPEKERTLRIEFGELPNLTADATMITQLFQNLLTNAVKYTRTTEKALIRIEGKTSTDEIVYSITDNGIGFDMQNADRMFGLFRRLPNAQDYEGSGVGMAIVKQIVTRHQGKIWFNSKPGAGTTFWISFPQKPEHANG